MKQKTAFMLAFTLLVSNCAIKAQSDSKLQWWQEAKFGLFLHWGLYSIGEWNGKLDIPLKLTSDS